MGFDSACLPRKKPDGYYVIAAGPLTYRVCTVQYGVDENKPAYFAIVVVNSYSGDDEVESAHVQVSTSPSGERCVFGDLCQTKNPKHGKVGNVASSLSCLDGG